MRGDLRGDQREHPLAVGLTEHEVSGAEFGQSSVEPVEALDYPIVRKQPPALLERVGVEQRAAACAGYGTRVRQGSEVSVTGCGCCLPLPLLVGSSVGVMLRALWRRVRCIMQFDRIVVIFNPQSIGPAPQRAEQLKDALADRLPDMPLQLHRACRARPRAGRPGRRHRRPLIVSVSGDGGYNEVVDGVMHAGNRDAICAVMAAGNANDHRRSTGEQPLVEAIVAGEVRRIDLLRLTVGSGSHTHTR